MKLNWPAISLAFVCLLMGWFLYDGCHAKKPQPDHVEDKREVDSIVSHRVSIANDSLSNLYKDSLHKETHRGDSLQVLVNSDRYNLNVKGQQLADVIAKVNELETAKDTAQQLAACDSLKNAAIAGIALVKKTMKDRDDLDSSYKVQLSLRQDANNRLNDLYTQSNQQLFAIGLKYDDLFTSYQKLNKKPKNFGIGPSIGATYYNGKVQPYVGIGVHFSLIKF